MIKLSPQSIARIEEALRSVFAQYPAVQEQQAITDIHLQPKADSGELVSWDDDDKELNRIFVEEWNDYGGDDFYEAVAATLRPVLATLKEAGVLDKAGLMKPYSITLVDDDKETVAELMLVDDDTLLLNDDLLKGLDEELDAFLKDLLEK